MAENRGHGSQEPAGQAEPAGKAAGAEVTNQAERSKPAERTVPAGQTDGIEPAGQAARIEVAEPMPQAERIGQMPRAEKGLSRRDFLRTGAAAGALGTALLTAEAQRASTAAPAARHEAGVELVGPGAVAMSWRINGRPMQATLEPRVTLLDALRDHLELTGAKRVCDRGTCGACTVLIDGRTAYACSLLAIEAQGRSIETVEGLGTPEHLHPLQAAIVAHDGQQCGFCTPGFVMAAKGWLDGRGHTAGHPGGHPGATPTAAEVHRALSGNFCRCGTYAGLRPALLAVASAAAGTGAKAAAAAGAAAAGAAATGPAAAAAGANQLPPAGASKEA
jgi:xanthine dehydrogenase YagT iron-sulfur-binding subunit